jgi:phenylacetic acid degradation operon negative regulatory protein
MTAQRPQDLVFTLFGDFLLEQHRGVWLGSVAQLLRPLGLSEGAVRTVLSRMSRKGWLESERVGRRSYYSLTARGRTLLEEGAARIYHPPREAGWDGLWHLVTYSIPEVRRADRDRLRLRLQWLGFGSLSSGLWVSPHPVKPRLDALVNELGVTDHVEIFRAQHLGYLDTAHLVARCWNLGEIDARYAAFLASQRPYFERDRRRVAATDMPPGEAFVRRFWLVHEYRAFPLLDPFLPRELLPAGWHGFEAAELFEGYRALLEGPADRHVRTIAELAPGEERQGPRLAGAG